MPRNKALREAIEMCCTLLRESTLSPTRFQELIHGWPDYMGICDASSFGVGRVIVGENRECTPIVFQLQWPPDITANVKSASNFNGMITNSDLGMAGLLLLVLVMEEVVCNLKEANFHSELGHPSGIAPLNSCHTTHCSTGIMAKVSSMLPINATPHRRRCKHTHRHPITILWECSLLAFPN